MLLGTYAVGIGIWQAHKQLVLERVEAAGGVEKYHYAGMSDGEVNSASLANGQRIYARELFHAPELVLGEQSGTTTYFARNYTQRYSLRMAFGTETHKAADWLDRSTAIYTTLQRAIEDDAYIPEEIGVTEIITTSLDGQPDSEDITSAHFAIHGNIWGANFLRTASTPDPYTDPIGYQRWALQNNPQINLSLKAPSAESKDEGRTVTIIGDHGEMKAGGELVAVERLHRMRHLMLYYAARQFPDLLVSVQSISLDPPGKPIAEIK